MRTYISLPGKPAKAVKNLGWLLRHWREVVDLRFYYAPNGRCSDGHLVAVLKNGGVYVTEYASLTVCFGWLRRSVFDTLSLTVLRGPLSNAPIAQPLQEIWHVIGSPEYREILNRKAEFVRGSYDNAGLYRSQLASILP